MSNVFDLGKEAVFALEEARFRRAVGLVGSLAVGPRRTQDRSAGTRVPERFANVPDTDYSLHANIVWAEGIASRIPSSTLGVDLVEAHMVATEKEAGDLVDSVAAAAPSWAARSGRQRAAVLRAVAQALEDHRAELMEVAGCEAGKTLDQGDVEV